MKRFFMSLGNFFKFRNVEKSTTNQNQTIEVDIPNNDERVVLDSRVDENELDLDDLDETSETKTETLSNKQRVLSAIELHSASFDNKPFTTTMVYNWLRGEMPILSVRKCIYKLYAQGVLDCCKKTYSNNKKVKYYMLKNV
ncbi:MAG: hypothetical protein RLZ10_2122 [Bacteroidota bacterium]|jgi:hypothetical protein